MKLTPGTRVSLNGDSAELWIQDYNTRVSSNASVEIEPAPRDKKVTVTIDSIDGDCNVTARVRRSRLSPIDPPEFP